MPRIDFSLLVPYEDRAAFVRQIAVTREEIERLHGLSDRWLGEAVLGLARRVRERFPDVAGPSSDVRSADGHLLWRYVPEMARRLGCRLTTNEVAGAELRNASAWELRMAVGHARSSSREYNAYPGVESLSEAETDMLDVWTHDPANGSPFAMLLDRVAPPRPDSPDALATYLREVSTVRGHAPQGGWSPAMEIVRDEPEEDGPSPAP